MIAKSSARIALGIYAITLVFSVVHGLAMIWNESLITPMNFRILATSLVLMVAMLFYTGVCDAWVRIHSTIEQRENEKAKSKQ